MRLSKSRPVQMLYHLSVRFFYFLCGQSWFQNLGTRQRRHAKLLALFVKDADFPVGSRAGIIRDALMTNWIESIWGKHLLGLAPVIVEGREHIEKSQVAQTGIIFARLHQKFERGITASLMRDWLELQTFRPLVAVGDRRRNQTGAPEGILNAQDMLEAFHALRGGGTVQIAADGPLGNQKISVNFLGCERDFRTGFAELALVTRAQILPIYLHFRTDGTLVITISRALRMPQGIAKDLQVVDLVNQYAAVVSEYWKAHPHMILYRSMKEHMRAPKTVSPG